MELLYYITNITITQTIGCEVDSIVTTPKAISRDLILVSEPFNYQKFNNAKNKFQI